MGCPYHLCEEGQHEECKTREAKMDYRGCTCLHRVPLKEGDRPMAARFENLDREFYTPVEIAYMLNIKPETVRLYFGQDSKKHDDRKLLVGKKYRGQWRVTRDDLVIFLLELYGD